MGKHKHKRKKQNKTQKPHECIETASSSGIKVGPINETNNTAKREKEAQSKEENFMGLREIFKGTSIIDRLLALFTAIIAGATIYQFIILGGQLKVMQTEQRAWIGITKSHSTVELGKPILADFVFENTGKTPAKNTKGVFKMEVLNFADEPNFDYSDPDMVSGWSGDILFPNAPYTLSFTPLIKTPGTRTLQPTILTQDLESKFNNRQIWIAFEGEIFYEDVFRHKHRMNLCLGIIHTFEGISSSPPGYKACERYNNTDD
jgi:hypothetical protein